MGDKAWGRLTELSATHEYLGVCETHVIKRDTREWIGKARSSSLRLLHNGARPKSRYAKGDHQHSHEG
eukprot:5591485-Pyramimonas_sp.AAC.1